LPLGVWEEVRERLDQAEALVRDDQLDALEPTLFEVPQEAGLAGLVLFRTFRDAQDVSVAVRIDADRDQDSHVSDLAAPAALEIDAVAVDVRVLALERRVPPALDVAVDFLFRSLTVLGLTRVPQSASVMSSTRRTETPARYISIRVSSTDDSRRR